MMKKVLSIVCAMVFLFTVVGCSSSEEKKEEKKIEFAVNEVAVIDDVEYTITAVDKNQGTSEYIKPVEGKEYVTIHIKIENKSEDKTSYNPLDWKMVNSNGQEDTYSIMGGDNATNLSSGDLVAGGIVEGTITYEQPVGDTGLKVNFYGNIFDEKPQCSFLIG